MLFDIQKLETKSSNEGAFNDSWHVLGHSINNIVHSKREVKLRIIINKKQEIPKCGHRAAQCRSIQREI